MLESISLDHFKSFLKLPTLQTPPITILTGQNSSGKSTIIQALLLIKQSLESSFSDEPLLLNGAFVSLGEFSDILHYSDEKNPNQFIEFIFNFKFITPQEREDLRKMVQYFYPWHQKEIQSVGARIRIGQRDISRANIENILQLIQADLFGQVFNKPFELNFSRDPELLNHLASQYNIDEQVNDYLTTNVLCKIDGHPEFTPKAEAIIANKFLPDVIAVPIHSSLINAINELLGRICTIAYTDLKMHEPLIRRTPSFRLRQISNKARTASVARTENETGLEKSIIANLRKILAHQKDFGEELGYTISIMPTVLGALHKDSLPIVNTLVLESLSSIDKVKANKKFLELQTTREWQHASSERDYSFDEITDAITGAFKRIYYLGPLREEPKVFYQRLGSADPMYVGQKGENVAFVLKYYGRRRIPCVLPPKDKAEHWNPLTQNLASTTLIEAVKAWLEYLGVAKNISVAELGKIGLSLQANIHGEKSSDLVNVGVGVSQVLPIVVLGLASPPYSTILIEQPELHLHPYVQSRLADFFVSLCVYRKQVIAETHSEHLVHRMRYHIAYRNISNNKHLAVYFIDYDEEKHQSKVIKINIDNEGAIDNWPKHFFDETEKQLKDILSASFDRNEGESK